MVAGMVTKIINNVQVRGHRMPPPLSVHTVLVAHGSCCPRCEARQITIKRLHIRYEDHSSEALPVSLGIGIREVSVRTTDHKWEYTFVDSPAQVFKVSVRRHAATLGRRVTQA